MVGSGLATLSPVFPRIWVHLRWITLYRGTLKPSPVVGSQGLARDADRKLELYQSFCNVVGGVSTRTMADVLPVAPLPAGEASPRPPPQGLREHVPARRAQSRPHPPGRRTPQPRTAGAVPAHCRRCGVYAVMLVQRVQDPPVPPTWQVCCPNCGTWRPGYPLSRPRDVKG